MNGSSCFVRCILHNRAVMLIKLFIGLLNLPHQSIMHIEIFLEKIINLIICESITNKILYKISIRYARHNPLLFLPFARSNLLVK